MMRLEQLSLLTRSISSLLLLLIIGTYSIAAEISHISPGQKVLVICVKFNDIPTTRLATCQNWVDTLNTQVGTYFQQATYNKSTFSFETLTAGPGNGWLALARNSTDGFFGAGNGQEAIDLADPFVDFSSYNRVLVVTNNSSFFGQGDGFAWWVTSTGGERMINGSMQRRMTLSMINEWTSAAGAAFDRGASNAAHELGHNLALRTHYGAGISFGGWGIMERSTTPPPHFLGWAKNERDWLDDTLVSTVGPPVGMSEDQTIDLSSHSSTPANGTYLVKIPFDNSATFRGYVLEHRKTTNGDAVPEEGVLVYSVDNTTSTQATVVVQPDPNLAGLQAAALEVGDTFTDPQRNISVEVQQTLPQGSRVRVIYPLPADQKPDLTITPWGAPPWETPDLWIDSEKNGWGTYRYVDGNGNPSGNGDDPWLNRDNRIYFRVSNIGPGDAVNVRVKVSTNQPTAIGAPNNQWDLIDTFVMSLVPAGGSDTGFVTWRPVTTDHTCIKIEIETFPDELNAGNNFAQENIAAFETSSNSPWQPVKTVTRVFNPTKKKLNVQMDVNGIPEDWAVDIYPTSMDLAPNASSLVALYVYPGGPPGAQPNDQYRPGFIGKISIEARRPLYDTLVPLGGVDIWAHLVEHTTLTCDKHNQRKGVTSISGQLKPATAGAIVAVEFSSDKKRYAKLVKTGRDGRFVVETDLPREYKWKATAFFAGNDVLGSSKSSTCSLAK